MKRIMITCTSILIWFATCTFKHANLDEIYFMRKVKDFDKYSPEVQEKIKELQPKFY